jgi:hypothetical protein
MAWDTPAAAGSAGAARFVLERQYGYPVTPVRTAQLAAGDLSKFQVIILPDGGAYASQLGDAGIRHLKDWVDSGGALVALGSAVTFLGDSRVALLEISQENALRESGDSPRPPAASGQTAAAPSGTGAAPQAGGAAPPANAPAPQTGGAASPPAGRVAGTQISTDADYEKAIRPATSPPDSAPGDILRARIRPDYWLTAGMGDTVNSMVEGRAIFAPVKEDKGVNAAYYEPADKLVVGGYLWSENRKQLAYKPLVVSGAFGRGVVVGFTADPNFRGMLDGMNLLFLNAVFRGPAHTRGLGQ